MTTNRDRRIANLRRYFSRYPERNGSGLALFARRGVVDRHQVISSWLPSTEGRSILDAGCGDGVFLSRVLRGRPACIKLEDIVDRWPAVARAHLNGASDNVTMATVDCRHAQDEKRYSIVFALGVSDYDDDWPGLIQCLIRRADQILIVDFPKAGTWHCRARRSWLRFHAVQLHAAKRGEIEELTSMTGVVSDCVELPLQWVVRFQVDRAAV